VEFRCGALLTPAADPGSPAAHRPLSVLDQTVAIPRRGPDGRLSSPALLELPEGHPSRPDRDTDRDRDGEGLHHQPTWSGFAMTSVPTSADGPGTPRGAAPRPRRTAGAVWGRSNPCRRGSRQPCGRGARLSRPGICQFCRLEVDCGRTVEREATPGLQGHGCGRGESSRCRDHLRPAPRRWLRSRPVVCRKWPCTAGYLHYPQNTLRSLREMKRGEAGNGVSARES
jgi:hypothetical protein